MAGEKKRTTPDELHWQVRNIGEQIKTSAPEDVGFALLLYTRAKGPGESMVAFAHNARNEQEKRELKSVLTEFANKQGGIILLS